MLSGRGGNWVKGHHGDPVETGLTPVSTAKSCRMMAGREKRVPKNRHPFLPSLQAKLFGIGTWCGAKLAAICSRTGGTSCRRGYSQGGAIPLQQNRHHGAFGLFHKGHAALQQVDANKVTELDLARCYQIGKREHNVALDGTLQMPRAVF